MDYQPLMNSLILCPFHVGFLDCRPKEKLKALKIPFCGKYFLCSFYFPYIIVLLIECKLNLFKII